MHTVGMRSSSRHQKLEPLPASSNNENLSSSKAMPHTDINDSKDFSDIHDEGKSLVPNSSSKQSLSKKKRKRPLTAMQLASLHRLEMSPLKQDIPRPQLRSAFMNNQYNVRPSTSHDNACTGISHDSEEDAHRPNTSPGVMRDHATTSHKAASG